MGTFSEKILVTVDVAADKARTGLDNLKKSVKETDGVFGKFKAGMSSAFDSLSNIGPAGAAAAGAGVLMFADHVLDAGQKLDAMDQKAKTVFGGTLGDVKAWAESNAAALGLTTTEAIDATSAIADLLKPMGFTTDEAADMSLGLMDLAGALSAWSGGTKSAAEVSQTFTKAMLGERDELKSLGISITEAEVQAGLLENGQNKLTGAALAQAKALVTQRLIMEKSTDAQKAWSDGSMDGQKQANEMQAQLAQLEETITRELYPALLKLTPAIADAAQAAGKGATGLSLMSDAESLLGGGLTTISDGFDNIGSAFDRFFGDDPPKKMESLGVASRQAGEYIDFLEGRAAATAEALDDDAAAAKRADDATKKLAQSVKGLNDIQLDGIDATMDAFTAQLEVTQSKKNLTDVLGDEKKSTEDAAAAALDYATKVQDASEKTAKLNGHVQTAAERNTGLTWSLMEVRDGLAPDSPLRKYLDQYIDQLNRIPTNIATSLSISGAGRGTANRPSFPAGGGQTVDGERQAQRAGQTVVNVNVRQLPTERELTDLINQTRRRQGPVI